MTEHDDTPNTGNTPPTPTAVPRKVHKRTEYITIRVSLPLKEKLIAMAEQVNRPLSWLTNNILEKEANNQKTIDT